MTNPRHAAPSSPQLLKVVRRLVLPLTAGIVVFGAVTAFATTLSVGSGSLSSGNASVSACNTSAAVNYTTTYAASLPGYKVATAPVNTAVACASKAYKVILTGAANASLGEVTGTLDSAGSATPDFSASNVSAALVTGVSVTITG